MRTLSDIIRDWSDAKVSGDQEAFNKAAFELTQRVWRPGIGMTFQELLESYGYEEIKPKVRRKNNGILK